MSGCTHTSAWRKEQKPCMICGAPYDEIEQMLLGKSSRTFSKAQEEQIERMKAEATDDL